MKQKVHSQSYQKIIQTCNDAWLVDAVDACSLALSMYCSVCQTQTYT